MTLRSILLGMLLAVPALWALDLRIAGVANETVSAAVGKLECAPPYKPRSKEKK